MSYKRIGRLILIAMILVAFVFTGSTSVGNASSIPGDIPRPFWWEGESCDSGHFGETATVLTTWNGLEACGPTGTSIGVDFKDLSGTTMTTENEWQCTELVKRYLWVAYGLPSVQADGDEIVDAYNDEYGTGPNPRVIAFENGVDNEFPSVGDVLSYSTVHTAIITAITVDDAVNGDATLDLIEQNGSTENGTTTQQVVGWKIKGGVDQPNPQPEDPDTVTGWLHPVPHKWWNESSPSMPGYITGINVTGITALSLTNVWTVGHYKNTNGYWSPIMWQNDGTTWTARGINPPNWNTNNYLYGTASASNGNLWAVGSMNNGHETLVYRWGGSSWTGIASDNGQPPASSNNYLKAITDDGNGNIWTVGYYLRNGYSCPTGHGPIIEKYNSGTNRFNLVPNIPPAGTCAELNAVSSSSSTNAWAVGVQYDGSWNPYFLVLHYDGTSWTQDTSFTPSGLLTGVYALSSSDVWVIGRDLSYNPLIYHYDGSSWTDMYLSFPSNTLLYAIAGDAADNIWVVGSYDPSASFTVPFTLHWNGYFWDYFDSPYPAGQRSVVAASVTVYDGRAWFGGSRNPSGTSYAYPNAQKFDENNQ